MSTPDAKRFREKVCKEKSWFGHVQRKESERCWVYWEKDADDGAARKEETGERPKRRFMDAAREDVTAADVTEEDAEERADWRRGIRCGDP